MSIVLDIDEGYYVQYRLERHFWWGTVLRSLTLDFYVERIALML